VVARVQGANSVSALRARTQISVISTSSCHPNSVNCAPLAVQREDAMARSIS
jgi:hypothetical protein